MKSSKWNAKWKRHSKWEVLSKVPAICRNDRVPLFQLSGRMRLVVDYSERTNFSDTCSSCSTRSISIICLFLFCPHCWLRLVPSAIAGLKFCRAHGARNGTVWIAVRMAVKIVLQTVVQTVHQDLERASAYRPTNTLARISADLLLLFKWFS